MRERFNLPNNNDWADVRFEFPSGTKLTDIRIYQNDAGIHCVDIPLYVLSSNNYELIGKHTVWVRHYTACGNLDRLFHKYADLSERVFRIGRIGYKGDPTTKYNIVELNISVKK